MNASTPSDIINDKSKQLVSSHLGRHCAANTKPPINGEKFAICGTHRQIPMTTITHKADDQVRIQ